MLRWPIEDAIQTTRKDRLSAFAQTIVLLIGLGQPVTARDQHAQVLNECRTADRDILLWLLNLAQEFEYEHAGAWHGIVY